MLLLYNTMLHPSQCNFSCKIPCVMNHMSLDRPFLFFSFQDVSVAIGLELTIFYLQSSSQLTSESTVPYYPSSSTPARRRGVQSASSQNRWACGLWWLQVVRQWLSGSEEVPTPNSVFFPCIYFHFNQYLRNFDLQGWSCNIFFAFLLVLFFMYD